MDIEERGGGERKFLTRQDFRGGGV
jgi:hypothetical protein